MHACMIALMVALGSVGIPPAEAKELAKEYGRGVLFFALVSGSRSIEVVGKTQASVDAYVKLWGNSTDSAKRVCGLAQEPANYLVFDNRRRPRALSALDGSNLELEATWSGLTLPALSSRIVEYSEKPLVRIFLGGARFESLAPPVRVRK